MPVPRSPLRPCSEVSIQQTERPGTAPYVCFASLPRRRCRRAPRASGAGQIRTHRRSLWSVENTMPGSVFRSDASQLSKKNEDRPNRALFSRNASWAPLKTPAGPSPRKNHAKNVSFPPGSSASRRAGSESSSRSVVLSSAVLRVEPDPASSVARSCTDQRCD